MQSKSAKSTKSANRISAGSSSPPSRVVWAVEQLSIQPADQLLEIGCGAGHAVALICSRLNGGTITAIDRSALQAGRARARNRACVEAGKASIHKLSLDEAPARLARTFRKVFAINVNAFWTDPRASLPELKQLLAPRARARAYLVYEPPSAAVLRRLAASLPTLLDEAEFEVEEVRVAKPASANLLAVVARAPPRSPRRCGTSRRNTRARRLSSPCDGANRRPASLGDPSPFL